MSVGGRRRGPLLVLAAITAGVGCGGDDRGTAPAESVAVTDVWARSTPPATTGAVYAELTSATDDALVAVDVDEDVAGGAVLHETATTDDGSGMVTMRPVERVALPAGESVVLEPGGVHLMLVDLAGPLEVGDTVELTFRFETAAHESVTATVEDR